MLGICAFLLMVILLSFRESNAIFTDLSFFDFIYGVIFVEQFFESFLQDGYIRILGYMVYLWVNLVGIKCYSQFLHPVQA